MSDTPITDENEVMFDFETALDPMGFLPGTKFVESCVTRQLERELNEARAQNAKLLSDIYAHEHINTQMIFEKRKLECELKEARADKERLDWLEARTSVTWNDDPPAFIASPIFAPCKTTLRAAIDAARKEQA